MNCGNFNILTRINVGNIFCCQSVNMRMCAKSFENKIFELNNSKIVNSILTLDFVKHVCFAIFDQSMIEKASPRKCWLRNVSSNYRDYMNNIKIQRRSNQNKHVAHYRCNFADRLTCGDNE